MKPSTQVYLIASGIIAVITALCGASGVATLLTFGIVMGAGRLIQIIVEWR